MFFMRSNMTIAVVDMMSNKTVTIGNQTKIIVGTPSFFVNFSTNLMIYTTHVITGPSGIVGFQD